MTNKQKYNVIIQKINALEIEKEKYYELLLEELTDKKELFDVIMYSDTHDGYCIDYTPGGILESELADCYTRHATVDIIVIVDKITDGGYVLPTYSEHLEMHSFFDIEDEFSEEDYENLKNKTYVERITTQDFVDFVDDVIKAKVSSFTYDW